MAKNSLEIPQQSQLHKDLLKKLQARIRMADKGQQIIRDRLIQAEETTLAFIPEQEVDMARRLRRENQGVPTYTTLMVPYSYALLMSAHTYWTSVFFARTPVHQFAGRHGEGEMQVQAMEALISYQVEVGAMLAPYYVWFYDAGKYGHGVLGSYWEKDKLQYGQIVEMEDPNGVPGSGNFVTMQVTREVDGYCGNRAYNISPWDFMHDPRVALRDFQRGEFCCVRKRLGWSQILRRKDQGYFNDNTDDLKNHVVDKGYQWGSSALIKPQFNVFLYEATDESNKHPPGAVFWEVYVELVPNEWGVGSTKYPQKWCFTITEDLSLIVGATPLGYAHCQFPVDVLQCEVEGYGLFTRGIPEIMQPIQNTIDWLINTHFYNVRASMNNQFIVDPSKLVIKDVKNSGPGFVWRLRPEAFGTDISKMFMQVPVQDVTRGHIADFQQMLGIGERVLGVNDQIMGTLNPSGPRKTATETRITTGFGINRLKTTSEWMGHSGFSPHAQKLVQSSQQMYDATQKLRRVGSLAMDAGEAFVNVSPEDIVGFFDIVPVDGNLPIDRMAQASLWKEIMANSRNLPVEVQMGYDWGRIFAWAAQLGGLKNITNFKVQVAPDALLAAKMQQGNIIPMPTRGQRKPQPGASGRPGLGGSSTEMGLNAMADQASQAAGVA